MSRAFLRGNQTMSEDKLLPEADTLDSLEEAGGAGRVTHMSDGASLLRRIDPTSVLPVALRNGNFSENILTRARANPLAHPLLRANKLTTIADSRELVNQI